MARGRPRLPVEKNNQEASLVQNQGPLPMHLRFRHVIFAF
jgi:hypothetical protein